MKKIIAMILVIALTAAISVGATLAYLTDTDEDVNVMTMGNVSIEQLEYERVVENGAWVSTGETDKYGYTPDKVQPFTQAKPLYPAVFADGAIKWDDRNGSQNASGTGSHQQSWGQVGASGSNQLFDSSVKNVIDKFVFVKNTGKSDAYVRTFIALEQGSIEADSFEDIIMTNSNPDHWSWETVATDVVIGDSEYFVIVATYLGPKSNPTGILAPGAVSYPSLLQVYMRPEATNEDVEAIDGNGNGTYDILVLSQAVQAAGFVDAKTALDAAFGEITATNHPWSENAPVIPSYDSSAEDLKNAIENAEAGDEIVLTSDVTLSETLSVPSGVTLSLDGVNINGTVKALGDLTINGDAYIKTLTATSGGTITVEEGKTLALTNFNFGSSSTAASVYTITGGTVTANYGFFQHGTYALHSDFETGYMYYSYGSDITVYGTFHSQGKGDGLDYIRGKLTIADGGKSIHDKSLWVGQPESWGAMSAALIVEDGGYVQANSLSVYAGSTLQIDAENMQAGEVDAVVCNKITNSGTVEAINNDALTAAVEGNKIILTAK